jgi:hypothetical protein
MYNIQTIPPIFTTISTNVKSQFRTHWKNKELPEACAPTLTRVPTGCHPILSQDELKALFILAVLNVSMANYPLFTLLRIFNLKEELLNKATHHVVKFCCRSGKKNAFKRYTTKWIAVDPRGAMIIQQFLEFCSTVNKMYVIPLSEDIKANQENALKRRFRIHGDLPPTFGRFYFCLSQHKLSLTVKHPTSEDLIFSSFYSIRNVADPCRYVFAMVFNKRKEKHDKKFITSRMQRVGGSTRKQTPVLNPLTDKIICSAKRRNANKIKFNKLLSWCNMPILYASIVGNIFYPTAKGYTVCIECGATCLFIYCRMTALGPICDIHRPHEASFFFEQKYYNVKDKELNAFLNKDYRPSQMWMCEIVACQNRARDTVETIRKHQECMVIGLDNRLRYMRVCQNHFNMLLIMTSGGRFRDSITCINEDAVQKMLQKYGTNDIRRFKYSGYLGNTMYYDN